MDKAEVIQYIENDDDLKKEVTELLLKDKKFKQRLAEEVFGMPIAQLGISVPGTIGEFFLEKRKK